MNYSSLNLNATTFVLYPSALGPIMNLINSKLGFYNTHHNYNRIPKYDWLSTVLISELIGHYASCLSNWTVTAIAGIECSWKRFYFNFNKTLTYHKFCPSYN